MRALTVYRAAAWVGVMIVGWSLAIQWGSDPNVGAGPPLQFGKKVVGAVALAAIAALALTLSGRGGSPPAWWARGLAVVASLAVIGIAWYLRHAAMRDGFPDLIAGPGWMWSFAGGGLCLGAAVGTLGLQPSRPSRRVSRGNRARR